MIKGFSQTKAFGGGGPQGKSAAVDNKSGSHKAPSPQRPSPSKPMTMAMGGPNHGQGRHPTARRRLEEEEMFSPLSPDDDPFGGRSPFSSSGGEQDFSSGAPEIAPHEIKRGKLLGKGSFAQVYAGHCRGLPVAVKVLNDTKDELVSQHELRKFQEEIAVHQRLFHPNVVLMMGACTTGDRLMIVQELMHKDLEKVLFDPDLNLSLARRVGFGREIALGMTWLHKLDPPVVHRDLKPSNCLLDREMQHLKIADFGLSSILHKDRANLKNSAVAPRGTMNYLAPEVLTGKELTTAADVYALGILLWQLLTRKHPYEDLGAVSIDGFTDFIVDDENRPEIEDAQRRDFPMLVELIERCWAQDPSQRPDGEEICEIISDCQVEIAIPHDVDAQRFWLKFFSTVGLSVKIERVVRGMLKWFRLPSNPELHSKELQQQVRDVEAVMREHEEMTDIAEQALPGRHRITAEWFGALINWFGPFDEGMLSRVSSMCAKPWFHGHLGGQQASRILTGRAHGVYLVRFSGSEPGFFTVSCNLKGKVTHVRIVHKPCSAEYSVGNQVYKTLQELLEKEKDHLSLGMACPGSPLRPQDNIVNGYLYISHK